MGEQLVETVEGLYDEKAEAKLMHINARKMCFKHKFINASLNWRKGDFEKGPYWSIAIEERHDDPLFGKAWGIGYGGIRFCVNCKIIDCIHIWGEQKTYRQQVNPYYSIGYNVETCNVCGRRILRGTWGDYTKVKTEAQRLIEEIAQEYGTTTSRCGSGFSLELPMTVSLMMDRGEDARAYVRAVFDRGHI
jgi:hypothetical protein